MGRTGGGSRGGHSSGGGHRSSSRSRGGHYSRPSSNHNYHGHSNHHHHYHYHTGYHRSYRSSGSWSVFLAIFIIILLIALFSWYSESSSFNMQSTIPREKLDTHNAYINDCIEDELGWIDYMNRTTTRLKDFWDKTGVQPYIIFKAYDPALQTDESKEKWTTDYYDSTFDREDIFLFVYFSEEDVEDWGGYMTYANGYEVSSVMDSEAIGIFWNYIDKYWWREMDVDDIITHAFSDTADAIMHVSTTGKDVIKWVIIAIIVIVLCVFIIRLITIKHRRAKEKANEDARILNTPINDLAKTKADNLTDKYL